MRRDRAEPGRDSDEPQLISESFEVCAHKASAESEQEPGREPPYHLPSAKRTNTESDGSGGAVCNFPSLLAPHVLPPEMRHEGPGFGAKDDSSGGKRNAEIDSAAG